MYADPIYFDRSYGQSLSYITQYRVSARAAASTLYLLSGGGICIGPLGLFTLGTLGCLKHIVP